ncbi:MarR family transcriptional regulator [Acinetobacter pittii]|uniref:MarR family winged helix-turn-helix transcriptional regulator n=1 Tax=Acinetobacter pittii TaxID=48296 RepID=UPI002A008B4E|nr:MarR family transcriptional regulator [Acinetobacter pittii]MDX8253038.1 MarR family transcriptional regulator [Acinetobacter pittii]
MEEKSIDVNVETEDLLNINNFLCFSIYAAGLSFNKVYRPLLDKLGLTYLQFLVMVSLWMKDGQSVGELGAQLGLESSTLTPLFKRLEAMGYLSRERNPTDERQVLICLTESGKQLKEQAQSIPMCIAEATGLTLEQFIQLKESLTTLKSTLDESISKTKEKNGK